jgi:hypothetical protein
LYEELAIHENTNAKVPHNKAITGDPNTAAVLEGSTLSFSNCGGTVKLISFRNLGSYGCKLAPTHLNTVKKGSRHGDQSRFEKSEHINLSALRRLVELHYLIQPIIAKKEARRDIVSTRGYGLSIRWGPWRTWLVSSKHVNDLRQHRYQQ